MKPKVASYFRRGFTMSRNARVSHKNNEHPITPWIKILTIDKETIKKYLSMAEFVARDYMHREHNFIAHRISIIKRN